MAKMDYPTVARVVEALKPQLQAGAFIPVKICPQKGHDFWSRGRMYGLNGKTVSVTPQNHAVVEQYHPEDIQFHVSLMSPSMRDIVIKVIGNDEKETEMATTVIGKPAKRINIDTAMKIIAAVGWVPVRLHPNALTGDSRRHHWVKARMIGTVGQMAVVRPIHHDRDEKVPIEMVRLCYSQMRPEILQRVAEIAGSAGAGYDDEPDETDAPMDEPPEPDDESEITEENTSPEPPTPPQVAIVAGFEAQMAQYQALKETLAKQAGAQGVARLRTLYNDREEALAMADMLAEDMVKLAKSLGEFGVTIPLDIREAMTEKFGTEEHATSLSSQGVPTVRVSWRMVSQQRWPDIEKFFKESDNAWSPGYAVMDAIGEKPPLPAAVLKFLVEEGKMERRGERGGTEYRLK